VEIIDLIEFQTTAAVALTTERVHLLRKLVPSMTVTPSSTRGAYDLTPGYEIGIVQLENCLVRIRPKAEIDRVMFLISYALDLVKWRSELARYGDAPDLVDAIIPAFVALVRQALQGGVLCGYRESDDSLSVVRGRVRFGDQIRRWYGRLPPVEVRFDDFTEDIDENRLLKAALARLGRLRIDAWELRRQIREFDVLLASVGECEFLPGRLPNVIWTRLNSHYRPAVELAKLILNGMSFELNASGVSATAFLVDMNKVFENFVVKALRRELGLSEQSWSHGSRGHYLPLDTAGELRLEPDFSWWIGSQCLLVGDAKYKLLDERGPVRGDVYQVLAYAIAAKVSTGFLLYAADVGDESSHTVRHVNITVRTMPINLKGTRDEILVRLAHIANEIRACRMAA
jgi:5-methylcytosine-specific restriction enzyme subunit McrC